MGAFYILFLDIKKWNVTGVLALLGGLNPLLVRALSSTLTGLCFCETQGMSETSIFLTILFYNKKILI